MSIVVNTNVMALTAQRNLDRTGAMLSKALERLSSGLRINNASDDPAGLAIATRLGAQVRGLNQALRNANDGIGLLQTAEGALQEITNIVTRIKELSVQAANGTNSAADRQALDAEAQALVAEVDRIAGQTRFGSTLLLDGSLAVDFQVGVNAGEVISVAVTAYDSATLGIDALDLDGDPSGAMALLDTALDTISSGRGDLGAVQSRLTSTIANLSVVAERVADARSRILDADFAAETAALTKAQILQQAGVSVLAQANAVPQAALLLVRGQ
jgi:flagellin